MKLLLNAKPYDRSTLLNTWGHWLEALDADSPHTGRIVTAVRFDGVDIPSFRAADVISRSLSDFDAVEVDTATPRTLVFHTLTESALMAASLADSAVVVANLYRQTNMEQADAMMPELVQGIRTLVTLTDACASALGVSPETMTCNDVPFERWTNDFIGQLATLLDAQAGHDWPTVADSLEYEVEPTLRGWVSLIEHLAVVADADQASTAPVSSL